MEEYKLKVNADVLMYAFRYALGRQTFAGTIVCEAIRDNIEHLSIFQKEKMIEEIMEQGKYGYGMKCDRDTWLSLRDFLRENICVSE